MITLSFISHNTNEQNGVNDLDLSKKNSPRDGVSFYPASIISLSNVERSADQSMQSLHSRQITQVMAFIDRPTDFKRHFSRRQDIEVSSDGKSRRKVEKKTTGISRNSKSSFSCSPLASGKLIVDHVSRRGTVMT